MGLKNWQMWRMLLLALAVINTIFLFGINPLGMSLSEELVLGFNLATILGAASIVGAVVLYKLTDGKIRNLNGWRLIAFIVLAIFAVTALNFFNILMPSELFGFEMAQLLGIGNAIAIYLIWKNI